MINNNGINLTSGLIKIIQEGIKSYSGIIEDNRTLIEQAISNKGNELSVGQVEELVLINQTLQKCINEAESILNKPVTKGF